MEYLVAAYTDTGIQKETNQDSICVRRAIVPNVGETVLVVVCDGMGGLKKGEVASAAVVNAFGAWFDKCLPNLSAICGTDFSQVRRQWTSLVEELHHDILGYSLVHKVQLGTTVTAFFAYSDRYLTLTIGDSRIYERKNKLVQLTQDQSLVAREIATGRITEEESRHHPQRNILLQCVGAGDHIAPVFTENKVQHDALYLICTDGLVHEPSSIELEDRFQAFALNSKDAMTEALYEITELCKSRGETDNITAVLLKTCESKYTEPNKSGFKKLRQLLRPSSANNCLEARATLIETAQIIHTQEVIGRY